MEQANVQSASTPCCNRDNNADGNCDRHVVKAAAKAYDPDDVSTWSHSEFQSKTADKLRSYWNKIESIKFLLRDGKVWVAGEQIQGLSDGIGFLISLIEHRIDSDKADSRR